VDRYLRRGTEIASIVTDQAKYRNAAGITAFLIGLVVSVVLFSNQTFYTGLIVKAVPAIGDLTAIVGLVLSAVAYLLIFRAIRPRIGGPLSDTPAVIVGVDAADEVA
jgi:NCS1 family nucleobase:cation symporter-1